MILPPGVLFSNTCAIGISLLQNWVAFSEQGPNNALITGKQQQQYGTNPVKSGDTLTTMTIKPLPKRCATPKEHRPGITNHHTWSQAAQETDLLLSKQRKGDSVDNAD